VQQSLLEKARASAWYMRQILAVHFQVKRAANGQLLLAHLDLL
jgi:hypothetical protein